MLLLVVLLLALLPAPAATAAPVTYVRTSANSGLPGYASLASGPGTVDLSTVVAHGDTRGAYRFDPSRTVRTTTSGPGSQAGGDGWATTGALTGTVPSGTWSFAATVRTDVPAGAAEGHLAVAVYAHDGNRSRLLLALSDDTNVLAGPGDRTVTLSESLGGVALNGERIAVEWYLVVSRAGSAAAGSTTALRQGASGDTVTLPGPVAAPALAPPGTLQVSSVGDNRVSLSWGASGDSRTVGYVVRRSSGSNGPWTDVASVSGTSYTDTGLTNGTRVYHTVVAVAGDGTRSSPSNATSAVPSDTVAPTAPTGVSVVTAGSYQLKVSWSASASSDVIGYEIQRSADGAGPFTRIAGPVGGASFTDTGLTAGATWYYRVVALDDDGLRSAPTPPVAGTVAPPPPTGLRVAAVADGAVALEWQAARGAANYIVERAVGTGSFVAVARPSGTSYTDGGLTNGTTYYYRVRAQDAGGGTSSPSGTVSAVPQDTGLPAPPTGLTATARGGAGVLLTWTGSGSSSVAGYRVYRAAEGGALRAVSGLITGTRFEDGPLPVGVPHRYEVRAEDASGNASIPATTSFTVAPSAPTNLRVRGVNETTVGLAWDASNDPRATYRVLRAPSRNGPFTAVSGALTALEFRDPGLILGEEYFYVVQAEAVDGTRSPSSNVVYVLPQDGPPTAPTGLVAVDTGAGGQISLAWAQNPEPDVVRYRVQRSTGGDWTTVGSTASTTFLDGLLINGQTYRYRVIAVDEVGNLSAPSATASATPTDTEPPPAPGAPTVSQSGTALLVQWPVAVTAVGYDVLRSTSGSGPFAKVGSTDGERSFLDSGVQRGTTYYYVIQARDVAGNLSPTSAVGSGTVRSATTLGGGGVGGGGSTDGTGLPGVGGDGGTALPDIFGGDGGPPGRDGVPLPGLDPATGSPNGGPLAPPTEGGGAGGGPSTDPNSAVNVGDLVVSSGPEVDPSSAGARANEALERGQFTEALGSSARDVAQNVGETARTFRIPLLLLLLLALYLVVQDRIDRSSLVARPEAATGGDDDDVEYLL